MNLSNLLGNNCQIMASTLTKLSSNIFGISNKFHSVGLLFWRYCKNESITSKSRTYKLLYPRANSIGITSNHASIPFSKRSLLAKTKIEPGEKKVEESIVKMEVMLKDSYNIVSQGNRIIIPSEIKDIYLPPATKVDLKEIQPFPIDQRLTEKIPIDASLINTAAILALGERSQIIPKCPLKGPSGDPGALKSSLCASKSDPSPCAPKSKPESNPCAPKPCEQACSPCGSESVIYEKLRHQVSILCVPISKPKSDPCEEYLIPRKQLSDPTFDTCGPLISKKNKPNPCKRGPCKRRPSKPCPCPSYCNPPAWPRKGPKKPNPCKRGKENPRMPENKPIPCPPLKRKQQWVPKTGPDPCKHKSKPHPCKRGRSRPRRSIPCAIPCPIPCPCGPKGPNPCESQQNPCIPVPCAPRKNKNPCAPRRRKNPCVPPPIKKADPCAPKRKADPCAPKEKTVPCAPMRKVKRSTPRKYGPGGPKYKANPCKPNNR